MKLRVGLLGPVVVEAGGPVGLAGAQQRRLVAALALARGAPVATEELVEAVWGDEPPPSARRSLHVQISRLRRAFAEAGAPGTVARASNGYALAGKLELDCERFRQHAATARAHFHTGDIEGARAEFDRALELWRGPSALADARESGSPAFEARLLDEERLGVIEDAAEAALAAGQPSTVLAILRRTAAEYPLRQRLALLAMTAALRVGERTAALQVYERTRRFLREQLGITPGPELRALHASILDSGEASSSDLPPRVAPLPFELGALQRRKLEYLFRALDADGDGLLEASSFRGHAERLAELARDDPALSKAIRADINGWWDGVHPTPDDGPATLDDWLRFWGAWLAAVTRDAEARGGAEMQRMKDSAARTFAVIDRDGDGRMTVEEYEGWARAWGFDFDAKANFRRLDREGKGFLREDDAVQLVKEFFLSNDPEAAGNFLYGPVF